MAERNPIPPCLSHLEQYTPRLLPPAYFIGLHPYGFRTGQPALILGVVVINGRPCFHLRYPDGVEDDTPIENEDFSGKDGISRFYEIRSEP